MAIPPRSAHANERHASLDQPAGSEALLAEQRRTVAIANPLRFARYVEELLVCHDAGHAAIGLMMAIDRGRRSAALEHVAKLVPQFGPFAVVLLVGAGAANILGDHRRG